MGFQRDDLESHTTIGQDTLAFQKFATALGPMLYLARNLTDIALSSRLSPSMASHLSDAEFFMTEIGDLLPD